MGIFVVVKYRCKSPSTALFLLMYDLSGLLKQGGEHSSPNNLLLFVTVWDKNECLNIGGGKGKKWCSFRGPNGQTLN